MQYIFDDKQVYAKTIEFSNSIPIFNIDKITSFIEKGVLGKFTKKEFRWSYDNQNWSYWTNLTQLALTSINIQSNHSLYLHFKYTKESDDSDISQIVINYNEADGYVSSYPYTTSQSYTQRNTTQDSKSYINASLLNGYPGKYYLTRSNHIGYQPMSSITGLQTNLSNIDTSINNLMTYVNTKSKSVQMTILSSGWDISTKSYLLDTTLDISILTNDILFVSPLKKQDYLTWTNFGVFCEDQSINTLYFLCDNVPNSDIKIRIVKI